MAKRINVTEKTTYRELKSLVPDRSMDRTPMGKTLRKSPAPVLLSVKVDSSIITVYESGWFTYQDEEGRITARAVSNCNVMNYVDAFGAVTAIPESEFVDLPFPIILSHFGERNIADQLKKTDAYHKCLSLDSDEVELTEELIVPDFTESLDLDGEGDQSKKNRKTLAEAIKSLTDRQKEVVLFYFVNNRTHEQIAAELGTSRVNITKTINAAIKKLKKYF